MKIPWTGPIQVLMLTAALEPGTTELLKKCSEGSGKFVFLAEVPERSLLLACVPTPTILDLVGGGGPSGPPTFVFLTDPRVSKKTVRLFCMGEQGSVFGGAEMKVEFEAVTVFSLAGLPLVVMELLLTEELRVVPSPLEETCKSVESQGATPLVLVPYKLPDTQMLDLLNKAKRHV